MLRRLRDFVLLLGFDDRLNLLLRLLTIFIFVVIVDIFRGVIVIVEIVVHFFTLDPPAISFELLLYSPDLVLDEVLVLLFSLLLRQVDLLAQTASDILVYEAVRAHWVVGE